MTGTTVNENKVLKVAVVTVAILMIVIHMIYSQNLIMNSNQYYNMHLGFSLGLVFLVTASKLKQGLQQNISIFLFFVVVAASFYMHIMEPELRVRSWSNTQLDLMIGVTLIVLALWASVKSFGWLIPLLAIGTVIYPFFGQYLPEPFTTTSYSISNTISNLSVGLYGGIYGVAMQASADFIFLFVVFSAVMGATGMKKYFFELSKFLIGKILRKIRSGVGVLSVFYSSMVGGVTGSSLADFLFTGATTMEAMNKSGYSKESSAAIGAAASTGAQITPPILGVTAFAMAAYSGVPYLTIMMMCIIPCILFFLSVYVYTIFSVKKDRNQDEKDNPLFEAIDKQELIYKTPAFVIPLAIIIIMLYNNQSIMATAFWAILAVLALSYMVPKKQRPTKNNLVEGFVDGALSGAQISVISAVIGLMLTTFSNSGITIKLSAGIEIWSGGSLILTLLILWVISNLLGLIGVSAVAYFTAAAFAVPVLTGLGVAYEVAHFFIVFPTIFALITPPVAILVVVAAKIAGTKYIPTAIETCKAAAAAFILPFLFVYAPSVVLQHGPTSMIFWIEIAVCTILTISLQLGLVSQIIIKHTWWERVILLVASGGCFMFLVMREPSMLILSIVAIMFSIFSQVIRSRRSDSSNPSSMSA
ncbi:TRAP transporter permease [Halalkalibacter okhensis]|uniref:TRAP C4-dicarboxylate transport system permease DctM subunit domain-containing protein n=1 Tax=Halalkalibacter okhensis TaxID=333138 RepID=A0A0B0IJV6_9BACI|nr:TRAP transporter fused permease subunit [Halalkalibacter okhensis]KHF41605.1 hypothetical protein LQ50_02560 [Halalkalibacter okhensis]